MWYGFEPPQGSTLAGAGSPMIFFVAGVRTLRWDDALRLRSDEGMPGTRLP
jgi:hypothetical protein